MISSNSALTPLESAAPPETTASSDEVSWSPDRNYSINGLPNASPTMSTMLTP